MGAVDAGARKLSKVINHPARARIIELLGERGALSWKELSTELGVKTGALYHHLDVLEGLVERDSSKRYILTGAGRIVYSRTSESRTIESVQKAALEISQEGARWRLAGSVFAPRSLVESLSSSRSVATAVFAIAAVALGALSGVAGFAPTLYYLRPDPNFVYTVGGFAASLAVIIALGYLCARLVFRSSVDLASLAASASLSFVPVFAASALTLIPAASAFLAASSIAYTLFLVFFQTWSAGIFGAGLSAASGVRVERTLLVSLVVLYATVVAMLLQGARL